MAPIKNTILFYYPFQFPRAYFYYFVVFFYTNGHIITLAWGKNGHVLTDHVLLFNTASFFLEKGKYISLSE